MRLYKRESSVKQNENFSFQEHVTEASLISSAGALKGKRGKSRCLFSFVQPEKRSDTAGFSGVDPGVQTSSLLRSPAPPRLCGRSSGRRVVRSLGGFNAFPDNAKEGGCLDSFSSVLMQLQLQPHVPEHAIKASVPSLEVASTSRQKESKAFALPCVDQSGSEAPACKRRPCDCPRGH